MEKFNKCLIICVVILSMTLLTTFTVVMAQDEENPNPYVTATENELGGTDYIVHPTTDDNPKTTEQISLYDDNDSLVIEEEAEIIGEIIVGELEWNAVEVRGNDVKITNDGLIENNGIGTGILIWTRDRAEGDTPPITSDNAVVINNGTIRAKTITNERHNNVGISSGGYNSNILNNGIIEAEGAKGEGIWSSGADSYIENSVTGTIETISTSTDPDLEGFAIGSNGENVTIDNKGILSTFGLQNHGIQTFNTDATITNTDTGLIETYGDRSHGIKVEGDDSKIYNHGTISTEGDFAYGIYAKGNNIEITNTSFDSITTTGSNSTGILIEGDDGIFTNDGKISTDGNNADGVCFTGGDITIDNNGTIKVIGDGSSAICMNNPSGTTSTVNNYGIVSATGDATVAILGGDGDNIVNLHNGSQTNGNISLGNGNDTLNAEAGSVLNGIVDWGEGFSTLNIVDRKRTGAQVSRTLSYNDLGAENVTFENFEGQIHGDGLFSYIDMSGQAIKPTVLNTFTNGLHGVVKKRLNSYRRDSSKFWVDGFGASRERDNENSVFGYDHRYRGMSAGFDKTFKRVKVGVMGGYSRTDTDSDSRSFDIESDSYFGGFYGQYDFGSIKIQASLIGGYEDHENERMVEYTTLGDPTNIEIADSDFNSWFISPSLSARVDYGIGHNLILRPSVSVAYSVGWYEEYHETGTTISNLRIDNRTLDAWNLDLKLSAVYKVNKYVTFEIFGGGSERFTDDDSIDGNLNGTDFRYDNQADDSVGSGYGGGRLSVNVNDALSFNISGQHTESNGDEDSDSISAGFKWKF